MKRIIIVIILFLCLILTGCLNRWSDSFIEGEYIAKHNDKYYALIITEITTDKFNQQEGKNVVEDESIDNSNKYYSVELKYRDSYFEAWNDLEFNSLKNTSNTTNEPLYYIDDNNNLLAPREGYSFVYEVRYNGEGLVFTKCDKHVWSNGYLKEKTMIAFTCANCGKAKEEQYNKDDYIKLKFIDYPGGCLMFSFEDYIKKGETYYLDFVQEYMNADKFINLDDLKIYSSEITTNQNLDLIVYNNGVTDNYIYSYIMQHLDIEFKSSFYSFDDLKEYGYEIQDDEKVVITKDNTTYIFSQAIVLDNMLYLSSVKSTNRLFDKSSKEVKEILEILYGGNVFESYQISVEILGEGYEVLLSETPLNG